MDAEDAVESGAVDAAFAANTAALDTITALRNQCGVDCGAVLAAATGDRPLAERETLWWAIAATQTPRSDRDAIGEAARALFVSPETPEPLLWPLARVLLRNGQGPVLDAQIADGTRTAAQAAAGCAVMAGIPAEMQDKIPLSDDARAQMGDCKAPWSR